MSEQATSLVDAKYGKLFLIDPPVSALDGEVEEPVFVLRAQDDLAVHTLTRYRNTAASIEDPSKIPSQEWFDSLDAVIGRFVSFRNQHPERIKVPN